MFTTTTSSKSAVRFTIDFFKKTITGTKASFDKSGTLVDDNFKNVPEYADVGGNCGW